MEQLLHLGGADRRGGRGPAHWGPPRLLKLGSRLIAGGSAGSGTRSPWGALSAHFASISINVALGASAPSFTLLTPWTAFPWRWPST